MASAVVRMPDPHPISKQISGLLKKVWKVCGVDEMQREDVGV